MLRGQESTDRVKVKECKRTEIYRQDTCYRVLEDRNLQTGYRL
jgi:hypothetical protein